MLTHLGFGTFVFFGVSAFHVVLFRDVIVSNFKNFKGFLSPGWTFCNVLRESIFITPNLNTHISYCIGPRDKGSARPVTNVGLS